MFTAAAILAAVYVCPAAAADLTGHSTETALLPPDADAAAGGIELPDILSPGDIKRYKRIFVLQKKGDWPRADRIIKKLKNRLLMGHVLTQRYLHPTRYRSRYRELVAWLKLYADHPDAKRLYQLAIKRRPRKARRPRRPVYRWIPSFEESAMPAESSYRSPRRRGARKAREVRRTLALIRRFARTGRLSLAKKILARKRTRRLLDQVEMDIARAYIGSGHYIRGSAQTAYAFVGPATARSGRYMPFGHWTAGLAAYRLGMYREAAGHFENMAVSRGLSNWNIAAASFWAARSHMVAGQPERVNRWLRVAASHPTTFYGLLGRRVLGVEMPFQWDVPKLNEAHLDLMMRRGEGRRAMALLQVGERHRAERELRALTRFKNRELAIALLAVAHAANLPALSLKTGGLLLEADGKRRHGALYPVPSWKPKEGFVIDRAIVFAFMRQESGFNPRAKSYAGARGLMQLMPSTAGFISRRRFRGRGRARLYDPQLNISLGQKYLRYLISHQEVQGDLMLLAAAYNGGPGNLAKWRRRAKRKNYLDPLLFIESIPALETRIFIERVLANLWIYRLRLNKSVPSLDALASGKPAMYKRLDDESVAQNARN